MMEIRRKKNGKWKVVKDGHLVEVFATEAEAKAYVEQWDRPTPEPRRYYRRRRADESVDK